MKIKNINLKEFKEESLEIIKLIEAKDDCSGSFGASSRKRGTNSDCKMVDCGF